MECDDVTNDVASEDQMAEKDGLSDAKNDDESGSSSNDDSDTSIEEREAISDRRQSIESVEDKEEKIESGEERDIEIKKERNLSTPPLVFVDDGDEADTEPEVPSTSKSKPVNQTIKKKQSPKKKRKKKAPIKKKDLKKMNGSDVFLGEANRKRPKKPSYKRKKIRKLLTENDLQEDTLKALREEEDRQKRLQERDNASKQENSAGISFNLLENENLTSVSYDFDFIENIDVAPIAVTPILSDVTKDVLQADNIPDQSSTSSHQPIVTSLPPVTSQTNANETLSNVTMPTKTEFVSTSLLPSSDVAAKPFDSVSKTFTKSATFPQFSALVSAPLVHKVTPFKEPQRPKVQQDVICISSESSDDERTKLQTISKSKDPICISSGSESSDDIIFAGTDDNEIAEDDPDVNNSGMHVDDTLNQADEEGRVLVNKNRPPGEPEIYLSPRLAKAVKPHQIGGIRFMFDNIVESLEQFKNSNGFGCILAHSMGLGKTLQVISFVDVFLRHTGAKTALCVVPVNTLLNWVGEFEMWLPQHTSLLGPKTADTRDFKVRLLSDAYKTPESRAQVIATWKKEGGVLLMGYEMFRLLTNHKGRRRKKKRKNAPLGGIIETIDLEEEDRTAELVAEIHQHLVDPGPDLIVCDEGHRIKNCHASISQALKQIATRRRIVLTGYPLQNNLLEYWCMVDFVRPSFLGTRQEFSNMFERPICNGQCADSNEQDIRLMRFRSHVLHSLLKGFVQRRSHLVLKNSLPPKEEYVLQVRMSSWQKRLYNTFIKQQKDNRSGGMSSNLNPIKAFSICCKIWNHPDVLYRAVVRKTIEEQQNNDGLIDMDLDLPETVIETILKKAKRRREAKEKQQAVAGTDGKLVQSVGFSPFEEREKGTSYDWAMEILEDYTPNKLEVSGKMIILMKIIEDSMSKGDKILVFSQSLTTLTIIEEFLSGLDVPDPTHFNQERRKWVRNESYLRLDGNTSSAERERMIQQFNDKNNTKIHLFLLSTRAGCLGINLVGANRVVVFDISWNPCHDAQAVCRVYRYGQTKKCVIYRLICDQTMEKKIYDRQISKQGMADRVVDELNPVQSLERQDITKLLIYDDLELPSPSMEECEKNCNDGTLSETLKSHREWLTKAPYHHESLLMDCKGSRLTKAEKRIAEKGYELEKRASSSFNYSRQSYASFYAAAGYPDKNGATGLPIRSPSAANRPVANVRPIQSTPYPIQNGNQYAGTSGPESQIIAVLKKSGINVQKTIAVRDVALPNSMPGPHSKPLISKGEAFYLIHGVRSFYIGTTSGRIFAVRSKDNDANGGQVPLIQGPSGQLLTPRERESQIIKTAFNALMRRNNIPRQPIRVPLSNPQPITSNQTFQTRSFPHPLQVNMPTNSQETFGSSINDTSIQPNSTNYYTTMQNSNPTMMNQSIDFLGSNFTANMNPVPTDNFTANINPVLANNLYQGYPRFQMPQSAHSSSAPQLSNLLNMNSPAADSNFGGLSSPMATSQDSDSNWLNFLREGELLRSSSMVGNTSTPSQSTQTFPIDRLIPTTSLPTPSSVPANLDLCGLEQPENDIIMSQ